MYNVQELKLFHFIPSWYCQMLHNWASLQRHIHLMAPKSHRIRQLAAAEATMQGTSKKPRSISTEAPAAADTPSSSMKHSFSKYAEYLNQLVSILAPFQLLFPIFIVNTIRICLYSRDCCYTILPFHKQFREIVRFSYFLIVKQVDAYSRVAAGC
ncbi:hypothetical protein HanHA300_Chr12g0439001 [Helianthus annuus]|nr:hypothetical protein HanHA300_Chr12g0439001 [Helianthus annuus]KAJ0674562.1 hypothetical protein HanLR1_Chr12g0441311 [Helianthus annuus]